ncbi:MAG: FAD:protein FMN transferase [bacterium]
MEKTFNIFYDLEQEFSRFTSESSLSMLNNKRTSEVSDTFIDILNKCKNIYTDTNFYFNPLINLKQLGYSKDFHSNKFIQEDIGLKVNLSFEKVEIHRNKVYLQEGQNLDLGGIVK